MAYRSSINQSSKISPHNMWHGREMRFPIDILIGQWAPTLVDELSFAISTKEALIKSYDIAREQINLAQTRQKAFYDHKAKGSSIRKGDWVLLVNNTQMSFKVQKWVGPYFVIDRIT